MDINLNKLELRWQKEWAVKNIFCPSGDGQKPKYFNFDSAPFPNGNLHLGHARNYILGDIIARYKRSIGFDVLYTTNFDSFGLPNELEAKKRIIHPKEFTDECISLIKQDLKRLGISYDWNRVNSTSDPAYYKWTQWLFLELYSAGLVYNKKINVNWCNNCDTVLSYMESENGQCNRCDSAINQKSVPQWFIALSQYSDELYSSIDTLDGWSCRARNLVKGFIGKTSGTLVSFPILGHNKSIEVFISKDQNINDVTFVGAAVNLPEIENICRQNKIDPTYVQDQLHINASTPRKRKSSSYKNRKGVYSGIMLLHPLLKTPITLVFVNYLFDNAGPPIKAGTPTSNNEDKLLATQLSLPLFNKIGSTQTDNIVNSKEKDYFHVRDWVVSRQKKWGTPLPLIECPRCGYVPIPQKNLPTNLKSDISEGNQDVECPECKKVAKYSEDTLDCYLDDVWCFLSTELSSNRNFSLNKAGQYGWFPTDQYHAGYDIYMYLHLYRFIARFLFKRGHLSTPEPILAYNGHDMVIQGKTKMSKHHHNAINVCELMDVWGADVIRIAIMLAANPNKPIRWNEEYLLRAKKQLIKVLEMSSILAGSAAANFGIKEYKLPLSERKLLEKKIQTIANFVTKYIEAYLPSSCIQHLEKYIKELHTAIKQFETCNINTEDYKFLRIHLLKLLILYAPFAPHVAEEAWEKIGGENLVAQASWPH